MGVYLSIASIEVELADRVSETTQTSGTSTYVLDGVSVSGYRSFVNGVGSGNQTIYFVVLDTTWEVGVGTITAGAPDTLSRDYILATSAGAAPGGAAIDWPTTAVKTIAIDTVAALLHQIPDLGRGLWDNVAGGNNAQTIDVDERVTSYRDGMIFWWRKGDTTNTASMTLNVNGIGAKDLVRSIGVPMAAGDAAAHALMGAVYVAAVDDFVAITGVTPLRSLLETELATTSGTTKDFTGIRSGAKKITVMFDTVSLSGSDHVLVRLGTASGFVTSGYVSDSLYLDDTVGVAGTASTAGFVIASGAAVSNVTGHMTLTKTRDHVWISSHSVAVRGSGTDAAMGGGSSGSLGGVVTQLRVMASGANTFDAGAVNIFVEYE